MTEAFQLGDAPISKEYREKMNRIARSLDRAFNGNASGNIAKRKVGFVLLQFEYGSTTGRCNFISNGADREDIVVLFKEMIARFEGQPEQGGTA